MKTAQPRLNHGFSLIEVAIVLVIISVLVSIVAIPLSTQLEQRRIEDTNKQLETIKEALIGYALANGRFPCPARLADNGAESVIIASAGTCNVFNGFVPAVTLGLSPIDASGFAIDAWSLPQNRIRYAVKDLNITATTATCPTTQNHVLTATNGIKTITMDCLASQTLLYVCSSKPSAAAGSAVDCTGAAGTLTQSAPFMVWSLGKNAPTGGVAGTDEAHNIDNTDNVFVSHTPTDINSASGEFDDLVTWPSLNTIFARMVQAGKLP